MTCPNALPLSCERPSAADRQLQRLVRWPRRTKFDHLLTSRVPEAQCGRLATTCRPPSCTPCTLFLSSGWRCRLHDGAIGCRHRQRRKRHPPLAKSRCELSGARCERVHGYRIVLPIRPSSEPVHSALAEKSILPGRAPCCEVAKARPYPDGIAQRGLPRPADPRLPSRDQPWPESRVLGSSSLSPPGPPNSSAACEDSRHRSDQGRWSWGLVWVWTPWVRGLGARGEEMAPRVPLRRQDSGRTGSASYATSCCPGQNRHLPLPWPCAYRAAGAPRGSWRAVYTCGSRLRAQPESRLHAWIRLSCSAGKPFTSLYPAFGPSRRAAYRLGSRSRAQPESGLQAWIRGSGSLGELPPRLHRAFRFGRRGAAVGGGGFSARFGATWRGGRAGGHAMGGVAEELLQVTFQAGGLAVDVLEARCTLPFRGTSLAAQRRCLHL